MRTLRPHGRSAAEPTENGVRHIIHADLDAFYASVEQRDRPELRGKPVLVGGSPRSRGVVAAASYEARAFGCRSAMPMKTAVRLCPHAEIVRPRFNRYRESSSQVMGVFREVTPLIEPLSMDEAFLDVTQRVEAGQAPVELARWIKRRVKAETELTISCGAGTSKSVAKIASDRDKPDGLTIVPPGTEAEFLAPLDIGELWGIGPKTAERLRTAGVTTVGDLGQRPVAWLIDRFGSRGEWFHQLARGVDEREVSTERETKSISSETTFAEDVGEAERLASVAKEQAQAVALRLREAGFRARTVQIKLRLSDFTTFTRQRTLDVPTAEADTINAAAQALLRAELSPARKFRLIGVGVSGMDHGETATQLSLFDREGATLVEPPETVERRGRERTLERAVRELNERFGSNVVTLGANPSSED